MNGSERERNPTVASRHRPMGLKDRAAEDISLGAISSGEPETRRAAGNVSVGRLSMHPPLRALSGITL